MTIIGPDGFNFIDTLLLNQEQNQSKYNKQINTSKHALLKEPIVDSGILLDSCLNVTSAQRQNVFL